MIESTKIVSMKIFCSKLDKNVIVKFDDIDWEGGECEHGYGKGDYDGSVLGYFRCKCGELHEVKIR